jgi:hypothetical protein
MYHIHVLYMLYNSYKYDNSGTTQKWVAVIANSTIFEYVNIYCIKRGNMNRKPNNKTPRLIIIN